MSRGMSRGGGGGAFPIVIAVLGTLIVIVIGIFIYVSFFGNNTEAAIQATALATATSAETPTPGPSATIEPIVTVEAPTIPPEEAATATPDLEATPTVQITAAPVYASATVWASSLRVRSSPSTDGAEIGKVSRTTILTVVDETSRWLKIEYNGGYGWVWRDYCVRGSAALPTVKPDPKVVLVESWTLDDSSTNLSMIVKIHFNIGVYGNATKSESIASGDFTITGGVLQTIAGNTQDTQDVTLTIAPTESATEIKITIKDNSIFNGDGKADDGSSKTYAKPSAPS